MNDIIAGDPAPTNPTAPLVDADRLSEIKNLLRYESSIAFYSNRAKESMLLLVAEVERLQDMERRVTDQLDEQEAALAECANVPNSARYMTQALAMAVRGAR